MKKIDIFIYGWILFFVLFTFILGFLWDKIFFMNTLSILSLTLIYYFYHNIFEKWLSK